MKLILAVNRKDLTMPLLFLLCLPLFALSTGGRVSSVPEAHAWSRPSLVFVKLLPGQRLDPESDCVVQEADGVRPQSLTVWCRLREAAHLLFFPAESAHLLSFPAESASALGPW